LNGSLPKVPGDGIHFLMLLWHKQFLNDIKKIRSRKIEPNLS